MQAGEPSRTARGAAAHRAAHQTADAGSIFADPLARAILGEAACASADDDARDPAKRGIRFFIAARSRFAEDRLAGAVAAGTRQVVVLGAGLDTFALRNPFESLGVTVFEVDHPATQAWKRDRLNEAALLLPRSLTFVPADFDRQSVGEVLAESSFDDTKPSFFVWLGVVPYLRRDIVLDVLRFVSRTPGSEIVFDYGEPVENFPPERRARAEALEKKVAAAGEPFLTRFDPTELATELRALGFGELEDIGPREMSIRFFAATDASASSGAGPHVIAAKTA